MCFRFFRENLFVTVKSGAEMELLVVGLGNPGKQYAATRHNLGHMVIEELCARAKTTLKAQPYQLNLAQARLGQGPGGTFGNRALLATCKSYMNLSGGPVKSGLKSLKLDPEAHLLVIHDDLDLEFGTLKLKQGGGEGGHNGLKSISSCLGTKNYYRLRCGISRPRPNQAVADYVLEGFRAGERELLQEMVARAATVVEELANGDFVLVQQRLHAGMI